MATELRVHKYAAARRYRKNPRNGTLIVTRVNEDIWALALILADGNKARRKILTSTQVIIINNPRTGKSCQQLHG